MDHLYARDAKIAQVEVTQPCIFYEDLPYSARPGAAQTIESFAHLLDKQLLPVFAADEIHVQSKIENVVERKRRLVLCYDSQVDDETAQQIAGFCVQYGGRERLWANKAWLTCNLATSYVNQHMAGK